MKVCVFVDGENFRHSIDGLFAPPIFHKEDYLPKNADWTALFEWIVSEAVEDGERLRTYWYSIKCLDFYPYNFPLDPTKLKKILSKHEPYKAELDALTNAALATRMNQIVTELKEKEADMKKRFDGWTVHQDWIAKKYKSIEFRRAGAMKCDLFYTPCQLGREKAVDVKLATDLITLNDIYDIAIIVSGDQDYVPAVEVIKDYGKQVVNVSFLTRSGQLLPGGAKRLNQVTDWSLEVPYQSLGEHLNLLTPHTT